jgi:long-chain acyl-CoA synthetase
VTEPSEEWNTSMTPEPLVRRIRARIAATPEHVAMRHKVGREWRAITYGELGARIDAVASWLIGAGMERGDRVAIFAPNSPSWSVADLAIMTAGAIPVPIYATDTAARAVHIVADAGARVAFVGTAEQACQLAAARGPGGPLRRLVVFDSAVPLDGDECCRLETVMDSPTSPTLEDRVAAAALSDVATIIYTSGTAGEPRGVILTYDNLAMQFDAVDALFRVTEADRSLCLLPLSHAYERVWTFCVLLNGAQNYYLDDPRTAVDAMRDVRPTCMVSVPRLYEKIYASARHKLNHTSPRRRKLFEWAIGVGGRVAHAKRRGDAVGRWDAAQHTVADRLILRKIRDIVGGPKNFLGAGGAALSEEVEEFFHAAGLLICQGYGLTETSPMATCNRPGEFRFGTVGKAIPGCEVRIDPDGEIRVRGRNVMRGYFGRPDETVEALESGWLKTGDIGEVDEDGFLRITDRKKDLIITSGGKNVAPTRIESAIGRDYYVDQIAVVGERRQYLTALVVPNFEALGDWARAHGVRCNTAVSLVGDARVVAFVRERIEERQASLARHERIRKFTLLAERFSQTAGEVTPTLKNVRSAIAAKYRDVIDGMYATGEHRAAL